MSAQICKVACAMATPPPPQSKQGGKIASEAKWTARDKAAVKLWWMESRRRYSLVQGDRKGIVEKCEWKKDKNI